MSSETELETAEVTEKEKEKETPPPPPPPPAPSPEPVQELKEAIARLTADMQQLQKNQNARAAGPDSATQKELSELRQALQEARQELAAVKGSSVEEKPKRPRPNRPGWL